MILVISVSDIFRRIDPLTNPNDNLGMHIWMIYKLPDGEFNPN